MDLLLFTRMVLRYTTAHMRSFRLALTEFLLTLWRKRSHSRESPSRLFQVPHVIQIERVYLILDSMHYEIIEQNLATHEFHLVALQENLSLPLPESLRRFKTIQISIDGTRIDDTRWQVRVTFQTESHLSTIRIKHADLILEDLTRALGWQNYSIIECPPPNALAA